MPYGKEQLDVWQDDRSHKKKAALKAIHPIQVQVLQLGLSRRDFTCVGAVKKSRLVLAPKKWSPHAIHTFETHTHTFQIHHSPTKCWPCIPFGTHRFSLLKAQFSKLFTIQPCYSELFDTPFREVLLEVFMILSCHGQGSSAVATLGAANPGDSYSS